MSVPVGGFAFGRRPFVDQEKVTLKAANPSWTKTQLDRSALDAWWQLTNAQRRNWNLQHGGARYCALRVRPKTKWTGYRVYCSEERLEEYRTAIPGRAGLVRRSMTHSKLVSGLAKQWRSLSAADRAQFDGEAELLNKHHGLIPYPARPTPQELVHRYTRNGLPGGGRIIDPPSADEIGRHGRLLGAPAPPAVRWRFKRVLAAGGAARVSLYVQLDPANIIVHHPNNPVIKDSVGRGLVSRPEFTIHTAAWNAARAAASGWGGDHIVPIGRLSVNRNPNQQVQANLCIRMWFCENGDGFLLTRIQQDYDRLLPEPFLWSVFDSLARACVLFERGGANGPLAGWDQQLVHCDIKPSNVFLRPIVQTAHNTPHAAWMRRYPMAVLGDFGIAKRTLPTDGRNPSVFGAFGTVGFYPPEHGPAPDASHRYLSPHNVYQVGKTMWCLANRTDQDALPGPIYGPSADLPGGPVPLEQLSRAQLFPDRQWLEARYSQRLVDLIYACLDLFPNDRITAVDLMAATDAALDGVTNELPRHPLRGPDGAAILDADGNEQPDPNNPITPEGLFRLNPYPSGQHYNVN